MKRHTDACKINTLMVMYDISHELAKHNYQLYSYRIAPDEQRHADKHCICNAQDTGKPQAPPQPKRGRGRPRKIL